MIREFSAENYLSIRDKQTISFVTKGSASELVAVMPDGTCINKLGILFGPNASGKSNLLIALNIVFQLLISPETNSESEIGFFVPFIPTADSPTKMSVSFYVGGIRYDYTVEFNKKYILKESLNYYPNGSKAQFYERSFIAENIQAKIKFGPSLKLTEKTADAIRHNVLNNHSVLSVIAKNSFTEDILPFSRLYKGLLKYYHDIDGDEKKKLVDILQQAYKDPRKKKFYDVMLCKADLNITGYKPMIEERELSKAEIETIKSFEIPDSLKDKMFNPIKETITFTNHSAETSFDVPLDLQSKGTIKYIRILDALYDLISENHVYYLDELGEDLHYDLLYYYINVFLFNSNQSQLIITSQETSLLQQDIINDHRSVVWFVDKDRQTASSTYSRGDSFGLHKNLSLYNSYRIGRLGAVPETGSFFINLDD
ncbi:MAG: ATP-binding protein [Bacteroidales bacterium]|nr:ATP-binding protein [Bacteroidales bacterium]